MKIYTHRYLTNQTPFGLFTNLWPTALNRQDRETIGGWYLAIHLGTFRIEFIG